MGKIIFRAIAAITLDGKIARHTNHFSDWTSQEDKDFLHQMLDAAEVIIVGNTTYKLAVKPLSKRNCLVLTRSVVEIQQVHPLLVYCNPATQPLLELIKKLDYKNVCILGGTEVYSYCLEYDLIDELYLTVEPIVFGDGLPLFNIGHESKWQLRESKELNKTGTLLLHYAKV